MEGLLDGMRNTASLSSSAAFEIRLSFSLLSGSGAVSRIEGTNREAGDPSRKGLESTNACAGGRAGTSAEIGRSRECCSGGKLQMAIETQAVAAAAMPQRSRLQIDNGSGFPCSIAIRDRTWVASVERA